MRLPHGHGGPRGANKHTVTILARAAEDARLGLQLAGRTMTQTAPPAKLAAARDGMGRLRAAPVARAQPLSLAQLEKLVDQDAA